MHDTRVREYFLSGKKASIIKRRGKEGQRMSGCSKREENPFTERMRRITTFECMTRTSAPFDVRDRKTTDWAVDVSLGSDDECDVRQWMDDRRSVHLDHLTVTRSPLVAGRETRVPTRVLSPDGRDVQVTDDVPRLRDVVRDPDPRTGGHMA